MDSDIENKGFQRERGWERNKSGAWDQQIQTIINKIHEQQGPIGIFSTQQWNPGILHCQQIQSHQGSPHCVAQGAIYLISLINHKGKEYEKYIDLSMHKSLCCTPDRQHCINKSTILQLRKNKQVFLVIQWLRLHPSSVGSTGLIPGEFSMELGAAKNN